MNKTLDIAQFGLTRPARVRWIFPYSGGQLLSYIKSKGLKKTLQRKDEILAETNMGVHTSVMSKEEYLLWLQQYERLSTQRNFDIIANPDWYTQKIDEGKTVWHTVVTKEDSWVGEGVFTQLGTEKMISAFKCSERISFEKHRNASVGCFIDYAFLTKAVQEGMTLISAGRSRNQFGVTNTLGYLDYKLRFGYEPTTPEMPEWTTSLQVRQDGVCIALCQNSQGENGLHCFIPKGSGFKSEQERFSDSIPWYYQEY